MKQFKTLICLAILSFAFSAQATTSPTLQEVRDLAKQAYIYAFPVVDNYRIQYAYFVDNKDSQFKGPWNTIINTANVYTPKDTAIQTPNSDTPYSFVGMDLRTEPLVLTIPAMEAQRYFSVQFVDQYTFNFAYVGTRTTDNKGGKYLVAGPNWKGQVPAGIDKVIQSETEFVLAGYRTQLFNNADLPNVIKIQKGYKVETLSAFMGQTAPKPAPAIALIEPLSPQEERTSVEVFNVLNFILQFCPTDPSEVILMENFAKIGVGANKTIDFANMSAEMKAAYQGGITDAWAEINAAQKKVNAGEITSGQLFGTRQYLNNNYLYRTLGALLGIYGNSKDEALYPLYKVDAQGQILDASKTNYTLHFDKGELPPVNAFWSVTMYNLPQQLLVENPIHRYLINSPMLPGLKLDQDGGLTIYIQTTSPGSELESNWLPAPKGPFFVVMRLYWPKETALKGEWIAPAINKVLQ